MNILHIDSSIFTDTSVSRNLSSSIVDAWRKTSPGMTVTYRDVGTAPLPHLSAAAMMAFRGGNTDALTAAQRAEVAGIETTIKELEASDALVIGVPMYNHSIPSGLKAWIDHICQAGRTFRYTATGPEGMLKDRPVIIASSRGGFHSGTHAHDSDYQEAYLKSIFKLVGLNDVHVIRAEGLNVSDAIRTQAIKGAMQAIGERFALAEA